MPIFPYKRTPEPPLMAVLLEDGRSVLAEGLGVVETDALPEGYAVWGEWERVAVLWGDGLGEALCWQGQPVRWRAERLEEEGWKNRPHDVRVLRQGFPVEDDKALEGLVLWRDWMAGQGARPQGSLGSSAMSLLRSTLQKPLWTSTGWKQCGQPIVYTMGGRQEHVAQGTFRPARHYDLPSAYAHELGVMRYGGHWTEVGKKYPYRMAAAKGTLCFIRARVDIPDLPIGPLVLRDKRPPRKSDVLMHPGRYPTGRTLEGVWTFEEVDAAADAGCAVKVLAIYIHHTPRGNQPFLPWWETVQEGRAQPGFAGRLAKASGNALWGQFCINPVATRTVQRWAGGRRHPKRQKRDAPMRGRTFTYAPDLAEILTGRVRADLYRCMSAAGDRLLCGHTDGIWTHGDAPGVPDVWREKTKVARLDIIHPQLMRYYSTPRSQPTYVMAGVPSTLALRVWDAAWGPWARGEFPGGEP